MSMEVNMKLSEKEFNIQTGKETITERDETVAEKKEREALAKELAAKQAEIETKETAKTAILNRIGLTVDELKTILG